MKFVTESLLETVTSIFKYRLLATLSIRCYLNDLSLPLPRPTLATFQMGTHTSHWLIQTHRQLLPI